MNSKLRILTVTDDFGFVARINRVLRRGGLSFYAKRVATPETFRHELQCHRPDVILSNGGADSLDGLTALAVAKEIRSDVPFIFVAASPEEEIAAETLPAGAPADASRSVLSRLCAAVRRAIREAKTACQTPRHGTARPYLALADSVTRPVFPLSASKLVSFRSAIPLKSP